MHLTCQNIDRISEVWYLTFKNMKYKENGLIYFLNGNLSHADQLNVTWFISCDVKYLFIIIENINLLLQL